MAEQFLMVMPSSRIIPTQIDDFDSGIERSRPGAIHFMPGVTTELTKAEYDHITAKHPYLAAELLVLNKVIHTSVAEGPSSAAAQPISVPVESRVKTLIPDPPIPKFQDDDGEL